MLKYAKIINEQNQCEVGLGTNTDFYQSIGMQEMEVEQAYDGSWYLLGFAPERPLEELKKAKREEINQARDKAEQGGFEYLGKMFDSDQVSCIRMMGARDALALAPETVTITWTCQDNTTIELNHSQLVGLVNALATWSNTCHQKASELKAQIDAATSAEELNSITWTKGEIND